MGEWEAWVRVVAMGESEAGVEGVRGVFAASPVMPLYSEETE